MVICAQFANVITILYCPLLSILQTSTSNESMREIESVLLGMQKEGQKYASKGCLRGICMPPRRLRLDQDCMLAAVVVHRLCTLTAIQVI